MLLQMRSFTRSWIAYVLLFLLAVGFTLFGVNGAFNSVSGNDLATVNGRAVTLAQLSRQMDATVRNARNQGNDVTEQDAIDANVHVSLLDQLIDDLALRTYAERLGLSVTDAAVAAQIRELPWVQSPVTGGFDEGLYQEFLANAQYTPDEFERDVREGLTNQMLMEALLSGVRAPSSIAAALLSYNGETRVVTMAEAPVSAVGAIPPPNADQVQAFYEDNLERLRVPEFRAVTLVIADRADFAARINVPEARIREEYDAQREAISEPERRSYIRFTATNEAQANDIAARLNRGETPAAVAEAVGVPAGGGQGQSRGEVTDALVAAAVFEMEAGGPARVVRGQLAPHVVVRVSAVTPAVAPTFETVRDDIRAALAAQEATELLDAAVAAFEEARGGGSAIVDAARQSGLRIETIAAVTAEGDDANGPVSALAEHPAVLSAAFNTPEGEASDFLPYGDADVVVVVDRVTPPSVVPLEEVRADLVEAWVNRERGRRLRELGEEFVAAVQGGQSFNDAARANGFRLLFREQAFDREQASSIPAEGMSGQIFAAAEGDVVSAVRADGSAAYVAQIESINRVDASADPQVLEAARAQTEEGVAQSVAEALQRDIVARARVQRNETLLNQRYRASSDDADESAQ